MEGIQLWEVTRWRGNLMYLLTLFSATLALGGFLATMLVSFAGKLLLPRFGGSEQILICCLVLMNVAVFMGYLYSHIAGLLPPKQQLIIHGLFLVLGTLCLLPGLFDVGSWAPPAEEEALAALLFTFAALFALPLLVTAATASLLQNWFSRIAHPAADDPYFLYGASLLGECSAIFAYSWWIEPNVRLYDQARFWACGYGLLALMVAASAACMLVYPRRDQGISANGLDEPMRSIVIRTVPLGKPTVVTRLLWIGAPAAETPLRLAFDWASGPIDIPPYPLLPAICQVLSLLAIALAFSRWPISGTGLPFRGAVALWPVLLIACAFSSGLGVGAMIALNLAAFFVTGLICYGTLAMTRPRVEYLTEFYLLISVGRLLGLSWLFWNNGG